MSKGTVEMNCANTYFWAGKTFAAQYFTAVPFGLNFQGMNAWLYHGGGLELWEEVYAPFDLVPLPIGNTGVQMTRLVPQADREGRRLQGPEDAHSRASPARCYAQLGVDVKLLPARRNLPCSRAWRHRRGGVRRALPGSPPRPAQGSEVLSHDRLARDLDRHRADHQQEGVGHPAGRPQGDRRGRRSRLQRDQPVLVRGDQRRGARRPREQPGRERIAAAGRSHREAEGSDEGRLAEAAAKDPLVKKVHDSFMGFKAKATSGPAFPRPSTRPKSAARSEPGTS